MSNLAGRRPNGNITMGKDPKFITGSEWEPVLGYSLPPKICFTESETDNYISKSSTCLNSLSLHVGRVLDPIPDNVHIFDCYDLARRGRHS